jgi:hypothetical protein
MKPEPISASTATRRVRFDTPGVKQIGAYLPDKVYDVPVDEAARLVQHKGFHYVDGAAAPAAASQEN